MWERPRKVWALRKASLLAVLHSRGISVRRAVYQRGVRWDQGRANSPQQPALVPNPRPIHRRPPQAQPRGSAPAPFRSHPRPYPPAYFHTHHHIRPPCLHKPESSRLPSGQACALHYWRRELLRARGGRGCEMRRSTDQRRRRKDARECARKGRRECGRRDSTSRWSCGAVVCASREPKHLHRRRGLRESFAESAASSVESTRSRTHSARSADTPASCPKDPRPRRFRSPWRHTQA